jgi:hypothetical protein
MDTMWFAISEAGLDRISGLLNTLLAGGRLLITIDSR